MSAITSVRDNIFKSKINTRGTNKAWKFVAESYKAETRRGKIDETLVFIKETILCKFNIAVCTLSTEPLGVILSKVARGAP